MRSEDAIVAQENPAAGPGPLCKISEIPEPWDDLRDFGLHFDAAIGSPVACSASGKKVALLPPSDILGRTGALPTSGTGRRRWEDTEVAPLVDGPEPAHTAAIICRYGNVASRLGDASSREKAVATALSWWGRIPDGICAICAVGVPSTLSAGQKRVFEDVVRKCCGSVIFDESDLDISGIAPCADGGFVDISPIKRAERQESVSSKRPEYVVNRQSIADAGYRMPPEREKALSYLDVGMQAKTLALVFNGLFHPSRNSSAQCDPTEMREIFEDLTVGLGTDPSRVVELLSDMGRHQRLSSPHMVASLVEGTDPDPQSRAGMEAISQVTREMLVAYQVWQGLLFAESALPARVVTAPHLRHAMMDLGHEMNVEEWMGLVLSGRLPAADVIGRTVASEEIEGAADHMVAAPKRIGRMVDQLCCSH